MNRRKSVMERLEDQNYSDYTYSASSEQPNLFFTSVKDRFSQLSRKRRRKYVFYALATIVLLFVCVLFYYYWYVPTYYVQRKLSDETIRLLDKPLNGSSDQPSRRITPSEIAFDKVFVNKYQYLELEQLQLLQTRLLADQACIAPVLYGYNIQAITLASQPNRLFINPERLTVSEARELFQRQNENLSLIDRIAVYTDNMEKRAAKQVMIEEHFDMFSASHSLNVLLQRPEYVWFRATSFPSNELSIVELHGDESQCVQSMLFWFEKGLPFSLL